MQHIIVGAGPAGVVAAETLRKADPAARITLIGDEPEPPYSRMAIPYYLVDNIGEDGTYLRGSADHFDSLGIDVRQARVESVNPEAKSVVLADGSTLNYDKLLLATGSRPVQPGIPGMELDLVSSCWTLEDARRIVERAAPGANVVLIGAGFIGCIILEALQKREVNLSVVETGNRMVPRMLNERAGGLLKSWCQLKGVAVLTSASVKAIQDNEDGSATVELDDGHQLAADLVITATGVRANADFLQDSDIQVDQGILVDNTLRSSDPDIYAAGDVAQGLDFSTGDRQVQAIQPTATEHGRIAALNMAGRNIEHHGCVNMNVLDTLGLVSCSFGLWMGVSGGDSVEIYNPRDYRYLNLQFDDDRVIGASCTGMTQHIGVLRGLIESRVRLGVWKQRLSEDPTNLMPAYMACTQEIR